MSRSRRDPGRIGSAFFALGCLVVFGSVFAAGMYAGRSWPSLMAWVGPRPVAMKADSARRAAADARPPTPALTFYEELAAPLAPASPAPSPGKGAVSVVAEAAGSRPAEPAAEPAERRAGALPERAAAGYTVQVGAFGARAAADALRARLAASGHDAYVAEGEPPGARYRVRVGAYATRDEARLAARRLALERQIATYVTPR